MSRPLQVYLEEAEHRRLEEWALEKGWSKSQAVRAALRAATHRPSGDPLMDAAGMVDGMPADASEAIDRYVAETYLAEPLSKSKHSGAGKRARLR